MYVIIKLYNEYNSKLLFALNKSIYIFTTNYFSCFVVEKETTRRDAATKSAQKTFMARTRSKSKYVILSSVTLNTFF